MPHFATVVAATLALLTAALPASAQLRPGGGTVDRQLQQAWEQLETVVEQYNEAREDLTATRARSTALSTRIEPLRAAMATGEAQVGGLAARAYRAGGPVEISRLLSATSPEQFADRLLIIDRLTSQRTRALDALARSRRHYEAAQRTLADLAAAQRAHQLRLSEKKRHIEAEIRRLRQLSAGQPNWSRPRDGRRHDGYVPAYAPGSAGRAVRYAYAQLGKPYQWGGSGPGGYDCSGLTSAAWRAGGVPLPHNSARQWHAVDPISRAELRQGDLVFYYRDIHHVAIYVGEGRVVHAPTYGERIRVDPMGYAPIYGFGRPG